MRSSGDSAGKSRKTAIPPAPGISATRVDGQTVVLSYRLGTPDQRCAAAALEVTVDVNDDALPGVNAIAKISAQRGRVRVHLPQRLSEADVVRVRSRTDEGVPSDSSSVLIRRAS